MPLKTKSKKARVAKFSWRKRCIRWINALSNRTRWILLGIVLILIALRLALPYIATTYVNRTLSEIPGYQGHIEDIDIKLWRGAYVIEGLEVTKLESKIPVPFLSVLRMDLSLEWAALWRASIVGKVEFVDPKISFVDGPNEKGSQDGSGAKFMEVLKKLIPLRIDRFDVENGEIHFRTFHTKRDVDIHLTNLTIRGTNFTNSEEISKSLIASIDANGNAMGTGAIKGHLDIDPNAEKPTFNLDLQLDHVQMVKLNDFLRVYAAVDVEAGTFEASTELAAADGKFTGYVKPLFTGMKILDLKKDSKNPLALLWEAAVAGVAEVFTNRSTGKLGTTVPLSGTFDDKSIDIFATIGGVLKNAFIRALKPGIEGTVDLKKARSSR